MKPKLTLSQSDFETLTRAKLKIFLSVDVVGSTEFKQRTDASHAQPWLNFCLGFLTGFPDIFTEEQGNETKSSKGGPVLDAKLWKSLGDELIFTAELRQRHDAAAYLCAFCAALGRAVENWKAKWTDSAPERDLRLKGTAWLVGFPVGNAEIPLETSNLPDTDGRDYLGPQVDTGFRLKEHSSPRKMVISADLAYLLTSAGKSKLRLFHEGDVVLKGVIRGQPYPLIWADCDGTNPRKDSLHSLKDKLLGRKPASMPGLKKYLRLWLEETKGRIPKPFIATDQFADLKMPANYEERQRTVVKELREILLIQDEREREGTKRVTPAAIADFLKGD